MPICDSYKGLECGCSYVHYKGTTGVGRPSHRLGSIGMIEREVSAPNLFQTPRPASPEMIFQNAKVLLHLNKRRGGRMTLCPGGPVASRASWSSVDPESAKYPFESQDLLLLIAKFMPVGSVLYNSPILLTALYLLPKLFILLLTKFVYLSDKVCKLKNGN